MSLPLLAGGLLLVVLGLTLLASIHVDGLGAADDAFITFRMARNLAQGHGLRFNVDGAPVEAASNFLLTAMLAGAHRLQMSLIQSSIVVAMVSSALTLLLLTWCGWRHAGPFGLLAPAAWATMSIVPNNATNGLESSLFTLLLLTAVAIYVEADGPCAGLGALRSRGRRRLLFLSSLIMALVSLTRPEGPMYVVALGMLRLRDLLRPGPVPLGHRLRTELWWLSGFLVVFLPYTVWRVSYFGMLLPNTFHAKQMQFLEYSKLESGALYLKAMLLQEPLLPLALVLGLVSHIIAPSRRLRVLLALALTQCLFMLFSGGDWPHMFGHARFLLPAMPLALWLLVEAGARLIRLRQRRLVLVGTLATVLLAQLNLLDLFPMRLPTHYHDRSRTSPTRRVLQLAYLRELPTMRLSTWWKRSTQSLDLERYHNNFDAVVGLWLRRRYGSRVPIASIQAGQFAYWSDMPFFDMFGLVTSEVTRSGSYEPRQLAELIRRFDPSLIAFYKWNSGVHHRPLVLEGFLQDAGYGLRYVFIRRSFRAFVVFEKGYAAEENPEQVLFSTMADLPFQINRDHLIAALDLNHPTL